MVGGRDREIAPTGVVGSRDREIAPTEMVGRRDREIAPAGVVGSRDREIAPTEMVGGRDREIAPTGVVISHRISMQPTIRNPNKQRLDTLLTDRALVDSREQAKRLILAGEVLVDGELRSKPGQSVSAEASIEIKQPLRYVSRGGLKLEKALHVFDVDVRGKTALDVGASTGGFTDCLLQHGAQFVYAVDVGYGQLAWKLRQDARVRVIERTNARTIDRTTFNRPIEICVIDVSFISLRTVLPAVKNCVGEGTDLILLIKPQFEAGQKYVGKGGVVRDPQIHLKVIRTLMQFVEEMGMSVLGITHSPIRGPAGNIEYLLWINENMNKSPSFAPKLAERVVEQAHREFAGGCE